MNSAAPNRNTSLSLLVIRTANIESALSFYRALGLSFVEEQHGNGPIHYSSDLGGVVLEIYPLRAGQEPNVNSTMLGFKVESLDHALAALKPLGIEPKSAPKNADWGRWVNVADFDGRVVQLSEA